MIKMWVTPNSIQHEVAERRNYQKRIAWPTEEAASQCGILAKRKDDKDHTPVFHLYRLSDRAPIRLTAREANILTAKLKSAFSYKDDEVKVLNVRGHYRWAKRSSLTSMASVDKTPPKKPAAKPTPTPKVQAKKASRPGATVEVPIKGGKLVLRVGDANERKVALIAAKYHIRLTDRRIATARRNLKKNLKLLESQQQIIDAIEELD